MKRNLFIALVITSLLALGGQAGAVICTIDQVPAATLLLPYFEVDLANTQTGVNTFFTVGNASAAPTVAHVTVWTDWSIPVFDFDIYLTGFDIQSLSLRTVLTQGVLPQTAFGLSNVGSFSIPGANPQAPGEPPCGTSLGQPPYYGIPAISAAFLQHIQAWLTGQQSPLTANCASSGRNPDDVAIGYITIDNTNGCSLRFPSDAGYFAANGTGVASNVNQLWGDYFIVDDGNNFAMGETLVHIEAQDAFVGGPNSYTFYGRYTEPGFADNREPTATTWASQHLVGGTFDGGTDLLVWRDATIVSGLTGVACNSAPSWWGLDQRQVVIFDQEENPVIPAGGVSGEPEIELLPFPNETQRVEVGGISLPVPPGWEFGWLYLNLNHGTVAGNSNTWAVDPASAQAWVVTNMSALGRFSVGYDAIQLDSACDTPVPIGIP